MALYSMSPYDVVGSGITRSGAMKFPNPFFDIASEYVPTEINSVLQWAEYLWVTNGTYRSVSRRVVRYFLTEIVLEGESESERKDFQDMLDNQLHLMTELAQIGDDFMTYGNVFISIYFPFDRFLLCPECGVEYLDSRIDYKYIARKHQFTARCLKCGYSGEMQHQDRRSPDKKRIAIIRWNPKEIHLRVHPVSKRTEYYWEIPSLMADKILAGDKFFVESTPWRILECIGSESADSAGHLFKFTDDAIYHFKEATLAGLPIIGWGIPPILPNFKLAYYIQVLRRYDEAIAMDYIIPFRILYPNVSGAVQADAVLSSNLAEVRGHLLRMIAERRRDPTTVQIAPFPIGYQMAGGEARTIAPKESLKFAVEELLNSVGYPPELYTGSLSMTTAPVALRLFEKTHCALVSGNNDFIAWLTKRISSHFMLGEITGKLRSVTLADDLERKALALQAAAGMDISKATAYSPFGINYLEEQRKVLDEQTSVQKLQQEAMADQQTQVELGTGGPQGGPGGAPGETPGDVYGQAQQTAQQLLTIPDTMRRSELIKIKQSNPTLHALVMQMLGDMRQTMATQGQSMLMQQVQQGQMPPPSAG